eukprot:COSAG04_NODE_6892_length_1233_cov_3.172673_2_plen_259_part_00
MGTGWGGHRGSTRRRAPAAPLHRAAAVASEEGGRRWHRAAGDVQQRPHLRAATADMARLPTWAWKFRRTKDVAVKVLKVPERDPSATEAADDALRQRLEEIAKDFVTEIEICSDLLHVNLVRLLGYSDKPQLIMVQELLAASVDKELYVEGWKPTLQQQKEVARGVARGMEYLHTCFKHEESQQDQPIVHRDLKAPNLLLKTRPVEGEEVVVKIADFGLSRDKGLDSADQQTEPEPEPEEQAEPESEAEAEAAPGAES